jgi:hypothetical protein
MISAFTRSYLGQPRADLKQNQFGASVGGPILKDRTFFFVAYQGTTEVNGLGDAQFPVYPLLTSDRSAAKLGAEFCPAGHLDNAGQPAPGYLTQAGDTQVSCDGSNINPVALAILNAKHRPRLRRSNPSEPGGQRHLRQDLLRSRRASPAHHPVRGEVPVLVRGARHYPRPDPQLTEKDS